MYCLYGQREQERQEAESTECLKKEDSKLQQQVLYSFCALEVPSPDKRDERERKRNDINFELPPNEMSLIFLSQPHNPLSYPNSSPATTHTVHAVK